MAGTDTSLTIDFRPSPAIILCEPQLGENIGTTARAMANFGLWDLRLVNPRDGWPNERAIAAASRADHVLEKVRVFTTLAEAMADLSLVYATTARRRELQKEVLGPEENLATLTRLVERFEGAVEEPLYLDQEWGRQIARGTVGLRIPVGRFVCKRKLSQDKDDLSRRQVIAKLREPGPYEDPELAAEMEREWRAELDPEEAT